MSSILNAETRVIQGFADIDFGEMEGVGVVGAVGAVGAVGGARTEAILASPTNPYKRPFDLAAFVKDVSEPVELDLIGLACQTAQTAMLRCLKVAVILLQANIKLDAFPSAALIDLYETERQTLLDRLGPAPNCPEAERLFQAHLRTAQPPPAKIIAAKEMVEREWRQQLTLETGNRRQHFCECLRLISENFRTIWADFLLEAHKHQLKSAPLPLVLNLEDVDRTELTQPSSYFWPGAYDRHSKVGPGDATALIAIHRAYTKARRAVFQECGDKQQNCYAQTTKTTKTTPALQKHIFVNRQCPTCIPYLRFLDGLYLTQRTGRSREKLEELLHCKVDFTFLNEPLSQ